MVLLVHTVDLDAADRTDGHDERRGRFAVVVGVRPKRHEAESGVGGNRVHREARAVGELDLDVRALDAGLLRDLADLALQPFHELSERALGAGCPKIGHRAILRFMRIVALTVVYGELGWGMAAWRIGFEGRRGNLRAVRIATGLRQERTPAGIGVGSTPHEVVKAYPRAVCVSRLFEQEWVGIWIVVPGSEGRMTAFSASINPVRRDEVLEVLVQERWPSTTHRGAECPEKGE